MNYSGLLRRMAAFAIDLVAMIGIYMALGLLLDLSLLSAPISSLPMIGFWFYGGIFAISWVYFAGFESSRYQATIGKRVCSLKVTTLDGKKITFWRATLRYFSKILSRIALMIGFLMIPFTEKRQGLHDKIAGTVVLKVYSP